MDMELSNRNNGQTRRELVLPTDCQRRRHPGHQLRLSTQYNAVDSGLYEISPGSKSAYFNIPMPKTAGAPTAPSDTDPAPSRKVSNSASRRCVVILGAVEASLPSCAGQFRGSSPWISASSVVMIFGF